MFLASAVGRKREDIGAVRAALKFKLLSFGSHVELGVRERVRLLNDSTFD
jgi:hypothetical protein